MDLQLCSDDDEFASACGLEDDILRRASARLSEIWPKRLRFSCALNAQQLAQPLGGRGAESQAQALQVYIRVRPASTADGDPVVAALSDTVVEVQPNAKKGMSKVERYTFSRVFDASASQHEVFALTTARLVDDVLQFRTRSSVVMAYGTSGTGKTFSIEGTTTAPGLIPQALQHIMAATHPHLAVSISFFEVYNDQVFDLLEAAGSGVHDKPGAIGGQQHQQQLPARALRHALLQPQQEGARRALRVREDAAGRVVIPGLTSVPVASATAAIDLHKRAARQRQQAATGINGASSRSHCVFMVRVSETQPAPGAKGVREATLSLVDLAGSERVARTGNQGERFKESCSINSSLMALGRCLEALRANQAAAAAASAPGARPGQHRLAVVPYRVSKLTHLFRDVLQGHGHLALLVAVSPSADDQEETGNVLRYAATAAGITLASKAPEAVPLPPVPEAAPPDVADGAASAARVMHLEARVVELERELAQTSGELADAQAALDAAESEIRAEVVAEIGAVIAELRAEYDGRLAALEAKLCAAEAAVSDRDAQLAALQAQHTAVSFKSLMTGKQVLEDTNERVQLMAEAQVHMALHGVAQGKKARRRQKVPAANGTSGTDGENTGTQKADGDPEGNVPSDDADKAAQGRHHRARGVASTAQSLSQGERKCRARKRQRMDDEHEAGAAVAGLPPCAFAEVSPKPQRRPIRSRRGK